MRNWQQHSEDLFPFPDLKKKSLGRRIIFRKAIWGCSSTTQQRQVNDMCLRRRGFLQKPGYVFPCISPGFYSCCTTQWIQEFTLLTHCGKGQVYAFLARTNAWNVWGVSETCLGLYSSGHNMRANSGGAILCAPGSCYAPACCSLCFQTVLGQCTASILYSTPDSSSKNWMFFFKYHAAFMYIPNILNLDQCYVWICGKKQIVLMSSYLSLPGKSQVRALIAQWLLVSQFLSMHIYMYINILNILNIYIYIHTLPILQYSEYCRLDREVVRSSPAHLNISAVENAQKMHKAFKSF